jgi:hypothetical protein
VRNAWQRLLPPQPFDAGTINTDFHTAHTINTFNQAITFLSTKWIMPSKESKLEKAREVVDILEEISMLLVCVYPQATEHVSNQKSRIRSSTVHSCLGASLLLRMASIPKLWRYAKILLSDEHL